MLNFYCATNKIVSCNLQSRLNILNTITSRFFPKKCLKFIITTTMPMAVAFARMECFERIRHKISSNSADENSRLLSK